MNPHRAALLVGLVVVGTGFATYAHAEIITGQTTDWLWQLGNAAYTTRRAFGDGVNHVTGCWSLANNYHDATNPPIPTPPGQLSESVWVYSNSDSDYIGSGDTAIAYAAGVTDVSQIVDASAYTYVAPTFSYQFATADGNPLNNGIGWFAVMRNVNTGYYGVLRCDNLRTVIVAHNAKEYLDATWWFQTDGSANFSSVPEPTALSLLGIGALALRRRR